MVFSVKDNNILAERLTLTGQEAVFTGNVGIGTSSPQGKLHVKDTDTQLVLETSNATADIDFRFRENGNNQWNLSYQNSTNNLIFYNQTATSSAQLTLAANGTSTFTGLVSGITPTAAANFTTKSLCRYCCGRRRLRNFLTTSWWYNGLKCSYRR